MNRSHRLAFWLALLPMTLGGAVLGLWLITDSPVWMYFGVPILLLGVATTIVVALLLVNGWRRAQREQRWSGKQVHLRTLFIALLMASNYPAAYAAFVIAVDHQTRYTVVVVNDADTPWLDVVVAGGGAQRAFGTVAPHGRARCDVWFTSDGELVLQSGGPAGREHRVVDGYVTNGLGGEATVVRKPDGSLHVEARSR